MPIMRFYQRREKAALDTVRLAANGQGEIMGWVVFWLIVIAGLLTWLCLALSAVFQTLDAIRRVLVRGLGVADGGSHLGEIDLLIRRLERDRF